MEPFRRHLAIDGADGEATVGWRWSVGWRSGKEGVVSTGAYQDRFEKRRGEWRCLERVSTVDRNWPAALFQPFVARKGATFKSS